MFSDPGEDLSKPSKQKYKRHDRPEQREISNHVQPAAAASQVPGKRVGDAFDQCADEVVHSLARP